MTNAEYFAVRAVSASLLKQVAKSPAHALAFERGLFAETAAQAAGTLKHMLVLEPDRAAKEVAVYAGRRAGKAWEQFEADNLSRLICTEAEYADAQAAARAVHAHPLAAKLLSSGEPEKPILWDCNGHPAKSKVDWLSSEAIVDLKFTRDSSPRGYPREAARYGLALQAAFYTDAVHLTTGAVLPFFVIACEPGPVYAVTVFRVPPEVIELGRRQYLAALLRLLECRERNEWPAYSTEEVTLTLPEWAYNGEDNE